MSQRKNKIPDNLCSCQRFPTVKRSLSRDSSPVTEPLPGPHFHRQWPVGQWGWDVSLKLFALPGHSGITTNDIIASPRLRQSLHSTVLHMSQDHQLQKAASPEMGSFYCFPTPPVKLPNHSHLPQLPPLHWPIPLLSVLPQRETQVNRGSRPRAAGPEREQKFTLEKVAEAVDECMSSSYECTIYGQQPFSAVQTIIAEYGVLTTLKPMTPMLFVPGVEVLS